jgi:hypothetical protein
MRETSRDAMLAQIMRCAKYQNPAIELPQPPSGAWEYSGTCEHIPEEPTGNGAPLVLCEGDIGYMEYRE